MQERCSAVYSWLFEQNKVKKCYLYGESPVTGLCNQISAVYTFLPVAILLKASLILAPLYSRSSFEITMREFDFAPGGKIVLPFHEMFDKVSFLALSSDLRVSLIDYNENLTTCITSDDVWNSKYVHTVQRTRWRSSTDVQILDMVNKSGLNEKRAIQPQVIIRIKSISKMLGFYNFNKNSSDLLLKVHHAVKPNAIIQRTINHFQQILSFGYWAVHVRAEPDVFVRGNGKSAATKGNSKTTLNDKLKQNAALKVLSQRFNITSWDSLLANFEDVSRNDGNFYSQLPKIIASVITSNCYQQWIASKFRSSPQVYVASGLFIRENKGREEANLGVDSSSSSSVDRGAVILALLRRIGLKNISTKRTLYHTVDTNLTTKSSLAVLYPEQEAYVDLQLARYSTCFIPAHIKSTFSYMTGRMKELDKGQSLQTSLTTKTLNTIYSQFIF